MVPSHMLDSNQVISLNGYHPAQIFGGPYQASIFGAGLAAQQNIHHLNLHAMINGHHHQFVPHEFINPKLGPVTQSN